MGTQASSKPTINNQIYQSLGARWYEAKDDPIALLRAESRLRNPWISARIEQTFGTRRCEILDVGCGAGFLANHLAAEGHQVTGLDIVRESLDIAAAHDATKTVSYELGNALVMPYPNERFDVVCAMDFLEHVTNPAQVIAQASRVLAPSGLFFFHTFNRNWLSWLVIIKGVEWFVKNTPSDLHVLHLFLKPEEVTSMCHQHGMTSVQITGSRPKLGPAFWKMLWTGTVSEDFEFTFSGSSRLGFTGVAQRRARATR